MGADGPHQSLLGLQGSGLNGGAHAHANQQRGAGVQAVGGHLVQDEVGNALVARAGHQNHGLAGQGAAAAGHIGIDLALVGVGDDVPPHGGGALADVALGVVLVEGLNGVVTQRGGEGSLNGGLLQQGLQLVDEGEGSTALDPVLQNAGVLAAGTVQLHGQLLVLGHGLIQDLGQRGGLLTAQLLQLGDNVVRQLLADVAHKACHNVGEQLYAFFICHWKFLHLLCFRYFRRRQLPPAELIF